MQGQTTHIIMQAVDYIENHLTEKIELEKIANTLHYSKYHLHRMFTKTVGITIHEYAQRRQLTEAAKLLVFSRKPIVEIALISGYESQQAFTSVFKAMYKITPAEYREAEEFYPLQTALFLIEEPVKIELTKDDIVFATIEDVDDWMELTRLTIDGYPCLNETDYHIKLLRHISEKSALILRDDGMLIGAMGISYMNGSIDYFAIHPQYRRLGVAKVFLDKLMDDLLRGKEISTSTYRAGDKADTGYREELQRLGFAERELLVEYGYPTRKGTCSSS